MAKQVSPRETKRKFFVDYIAEGVPLEQLDRLKQQHKWTKEGALKVKFDLLDPGLNGSPLSLAGERGYLEVLKWLVHTFNISIEDIRRCNVSVITMAIEMGRLECVKWLINTFELTIGDAMARNGSALRCAITKGYVETVAYLIWYFGLEEYFEELEITEEVRKAVTLELAKLRPRLIKANQS